MEFPYFDTYQKCMSAAKPFVTRYYVYELLKTSNMTDLYKNSVAQVI